MRFADRELIAVELRQLGGEAEELLHADGEVGAVEQCAAAPLGESLHFVELGVPAGGADDDAAAEREHSAHVFNRRFGGGEVDHHVHAGEVGRGERGGVVVFIDVEGAHAVAALAGHLGDERTGFSFTQERGRAWVGC